MLIRIKLVRFLYIFREIPNSYILDGIIINLGKVEDFIINRYTYLLTLVNLLLNLFANSK